MSSDTMSHSEIHAADEAWDRYQRSHDLSSDEGRTAGIDPASGEVWIGDSIAHVVEQRRQAGRDSPLVFKRIGSVTYYRKGARQ